MFARTLEGSLWAESVLGSRHNFQKSLRFLKDSKLAAQAHQFHKLAVYVLFSGAQFLQGGRDFRLNPANEWTDVKNRALHLARNIHLRVKQTKHEV